MTHIFTRLSSSFFLCCVTLLIINIINITNTVEAAEEIPQGDQGIAAKYPSDRGIASDPRVVLYENFEQAKAIKDLKRKPWTDIRNKAEALSLSPVISEKSRGKQSLQIKAIRGKNSGGHLFVTLPKGYDRLHARFYVRFAKDAGYPHHFTSLRATANPKPWPMGGAGKRPQGNAKFGSGIEPELYGGDFAPPGCWRLYTYWHEMRSYQNPNGTGSVFYGNSFAEVKPRQIPRAEWICVEMMMQSNSDPAQSDGVQAFWINGKLAAWWGPDGPRGEWYRDAFRHGRGANNPFPGFKWRSDNNLKLNQFTLSLYVSDNTFKKNTERQKKNPRLNINTTELTVWFDDVIVATDYIGPIAGKKPSRR